MSYPSEPSGNPYPQPAQQPYRGSAQPAQQPYPGFAQPAPVPPPRKSRAGKIIAIVVVAVLLVCGGGSAIAYFALRDTVDEVVQATNTRLVAPETLAGKPKITDNPQLQSAATAMVEGMKKSASNATSTVGAFYGDPAKQDMVMIAGASALLADPAKNLDDFLSGVSAGGLTLSNTKSVDAGPLGGTAKCADGTAAQIKVGLCGWADRGSLGVIVVYFADSAKAEQQFVQMRGQIQQTT